MSDQRASALAKKRAEMMDVIYVAALAEFSQHGLKGTSTQAIAERAGMSKQQLHYYIESKEVLYESILRKTLRHWGHIGLAEEDEGVDPGDAITRLIRRKLDFTFDYPQISRLFSNEVMRGGPVIRQIWQEGTPLVDSAVKVIENWVHKGRIDPIDPFFFLFHIWALTQHYADYEVQVRYFTRCPDDAPIDREKVRLEVTRLVLRGVGLRFDPERYRRVAAAAPA
ncbi:TetR family transcriptional regulator C-terminal domain-containing protein [Variovorax terrae]|uniref:TetR family transcriptional regulator C-terminal domain-containing protein n=1 Tax=Variovorax terrae TaxID=2923278 RepID=A0A9X2AN24_9BURK|nr:TetR family transcriptional regulator C-terminal domain-containing protein [Variovorax terrae]MCJ0764343.1 TetR family transcriptional regulator C-terminal domain-containing protein [Variovorax terrae]